MKKVLLFLLFPIIALSQVPQGISYQSIAYDSNGNPIIEKQVGLRFTIQEIIEGSTNNVYVEEHTKTTNAQGFYALNIGQGTVLNGVFKDIDWGKGNKFLKVELDPQGGKNYKVEGTTQFMTVPYALFAKNVEKSTTPPPPTPAAPLAVPCVVCVDNIAELKKIIDQADGTKAIVKGYSTAGDGGGGDFYWKENFTIADNGGTIIKPTAVDPTSSGRWVRQIDNGLINVKFFGATGLQQPFDGDKIQAAIDFAASNKQYPPLICGGNTVYIPNGDYKINNVLKIRSGISIIGENTQNTVLTAGYNPIPAPTEQNPNNQTIPGTMFELDEGRVQNFNMSNLTLNGARLPGSNESSPKNAMYLKAVAAGSDNDGGIWNSTFKNIRIVQFDGSGIILEGGGIEENTTTEYDFKLPNQFLIFENVEVVRQKDDTHALLIKGQHGQLTFINSRFDGAYFPVEVDYKPNKGINVAILNKEQVQPAVISFINCTFQHSEMGVYIQYGESITFDTCWFEALNGAIIIKNDEIGGINFPSRGINVLNSRFANAGGFGSLELIPNYITNTGSCIVVEKSEVNVYNNYVTVSCPDTNQECGQKFLDPYKRPGFIYGTGNDHIIREFGNSAIVTPGFIGSNAFLNKVIGNRVPVD